MLSWWRRHRTVSISAVGALALLVVSAIVTPLGNRVVDMFWPANEVDGVGGGSPTEPGVGPKGRLVALATWPPEGSLECDHWTKVAGLAGSTLPEDMEPSGNQDLRTTVLETLDALVWYHGELEITLTTADETPALIMAVEPVVFAKREELPTWGLEVSPGCGGPSQVRTLKSVLDRDSLEDLGVAEYGQPDPRAAREPFGPTFTVNNADAADIRLEVNACEGLYEFGVEITYVIAGETLTAWLGTPDKPYRIVGGSHGVERFHSAISAAGLPTGLQPGPLPLYPGAPAEDGVPTSMLETCS